MTDNADLITRLRSRHDLGLHYILTEAADELERLQGAGTTHAHGCWSWGRQHYACAATEIERLRAAATLAREALIYHREQTRQERTHET